MNNEYFIRDPVLIRTDQDLADLVKQARTMARWPRQPGSVASGCCCTLLVDGHSIRLSLSLAEHRGQLLWLLSASEAVPAGMAGTGPPAPARVAPAGVRPQRLADDLAMRLAVAFCGPAPQELPPSPILPEIRHFAGPALQETP